MRHRFTGFIYAIFVSTRVAVAEIAPYPHLPDCPVLGLVGSGDTIKLYLYEQASSRDDEWRSSRQVKPVMGSFALRSELSGDLHVSADGFLFLPLLGNIRAASLAPDALARAIVEKFRDTFGHEATVHLSISARKPIFIVGYVKNPGRYDFVQGMTLMHAIAVAGGAQRVSYPIDRVEKEQEKYAIARSDLGGLLVQMDAEALTPLCPGDLARVLRPDR